MLANATLTSEEVPSKPMETILLKRANDDVSTASSSSTSTVTTATTPSTTTTPTRPSSTKIDDSSLLAPSFVPQHLKNINTCPVNKIIQARDPPNMLEDATRIYQTAVLYCPECHCKNKHDTKPPPHQQQNTPAVPPIELYYAISPEAQQRSERTFHRSFKNIEDANGRSDYIQTLNLLLKEECEEKMVLYERYSQYNAIVQTDIHRPYKAMMEVPGIHNARPPIQPGDKILLRPHTPLYSHGHFYRVEIRAEIIRTVRGVYDAKEDKIKNDVVIFTWVDPHMVSLLAKCLYNVRFVPSDKGHQRSLAALGWLNTINPMIAKELLFPTKIPNVPRYDEVIPSKRNKYHGDQLCADLNEKQADFVDMVLRRTAYPSMEMIRPPMVLTGPAGTGKTKTLLVSILQTLRLGKVQTRQKQRILVCTPSHTACDVLTRRLGKYLSREKLFRMYEAGRPVEMVPTEILQFARQGPHGEFTLPSIERLLAFQVIVCTCSDAHIFNLAGFTNASLRTRRQCFESYIQAQIQQSHMKMPGEIMGVNETHFTHLFIDEAAQATEPETLIPLSVVVDDQPDSVKVEIALAGDPRQLSPEIYSRWAAEGLQKSLLERLLRLPSLGGRCHLMGPPTCDTWTNMDELIEYSFQREDDHTNLSVFLTTSYRGHPSFLKIPSKLFYFDKLRSIHPMIDSSTDKWCSVVRKIESQSTINAPPDCKKQNSWPIHFRGVIGHDSSVAVESFWGSNSWSNNSEAVEILNIVQKMVMEGVSTQSIGIMGAFRAQVVLMRRLLRNYNLGTVNVGLVEDYQSVEREVIILSMTRSNESFLPPDITRRVGLYMQPKRVNVALTRAEKLLIVVGNPKLMEKDKFWKEWLSFCYNNGLWYGDK